MQVWVIRSFLRWSQSCGFIKKTLIGLSLCSDKSFTRIDLVSIFNIFPHRHVRIYPTFIVIIADCFNLLFYSFMNVSHQVGWRLFKVCVMSIISSVFDCVYLTHTFNSTYTKYISMFMRYVFALGFFVSLVWVVCCQTVTVLSVLTSAPGVCFCPASFSAVEKLQSCVFNFVCPTI